MHSLAALALTLLPLIAWSRDLAVAALAFGVLAVFQDAKVRRRLPPVVSNPTTVLSSAFIAWTAAAVFWAPHAPWTTWLKTALIFLMVVLLVRGLSATPASRLARLAFWVAVSAGGLFTLLLVERLTGGALIGLVRSGETAIQRFNTLSGGLVLLACASFPVALALTAIARTRWAGIGAVAAVFALSLAFPMDAIPVAVASGTAAFLLVLWRPVAGFWTVLVGLAVVLTSWGFLADAAVAAGLHTWLTSHVDPNWGSRVEIWARAQALARDHVLVGHGFDSARVLGASAGLTPSIFDGKTSFLHPHNGMLQVWLELGLVGVILALLAAFAAVKVFSGRKPPAPIAAMAAGATTSAAAVWSLSFGAWQGWWLAVLGLTLCAAVIVARGTCGNVARVRPRILFLATEYYFFDALKAEITRGARQHGWDIFVAARHGDGHPPVDDGVTYIPFPWKRSPSLPVSALQVIPDFFRVGILLSAVKPDILYNIALKPAVVGSCAAFGRPITVVNAIHGFGFLFVNRSRFARLLQQICGAIFRLAARCNGALLLLINRGDLALVQNRMNIDHRDIRLLPGAGLDTARFQPLPEPVGETFRFLIIGRLIYMKGQDVAVAALKILRDRGMPAELVLCGEPDADNPSAIPQDVVDEWAKQAGIRMLGQVNDVRPIIADSHVVVLPSRGGEGLPRSLSEGAACERALIGTDIPGINEIVIPGKTGLLIPPGDATALADAMQWLIDHPDERQRLAAGARALVVADFSSDKVAQAHDRLYDEIEGSSGPFETTRLRPSAD